jgi:hypothetical protein
MTETATLRAPAVVEKLEAMKAVLAALNGELAQAALDAAEGTPGSAKRLGELRTQIETSERAVGELTQAVTLAERIDRQSAARAVAEMRADQFSAFAKAMEERRIEMAAVLTAVRALAEAYGRLSEATLRAVNAVPVGAAVPPIAIGREGYFGPVFGPCDRLILAELFRIAPYRADGAGRFVVPFASPPIASLRDDPGSIEPGKEAFDLATGMLLADIKDQIDRLDSVEFTKDAA